MRPKKDNKKKETEKKYGKFTNKHIRIIKELKEKTKTKKMTG